MADLPLSLRQLEYFVTVAELGAITAAAERMSISPSAVSLAITKLERHLDASLFVRQQSRGVELTIAGREILDASRDVLARANEIKGIVRGSSRALEGLVRIGCYSPFMPIVVPLALDDVAREFPHIDLTVSTATPHQLRGGLQSGSLDIAVLSEKGLGPGLTTATVRQLRPHVLLAATHPLAALDEIWLSRLAGEPLIILDASTTEQKIDRLVRSTGIVPNIRHRVTDIETVRSLVARGLGYSIALLSLPGDTSYEGRKLVRIPIADDVESSSMVLALSQAIKPARRVAAVVDALARRLATPSPGGAPDLDTVPRESRESP